MSQTLRKYKFFIAFYLLLGLLIPAVNSTMSANHELKARSQDVLRLSETVSQLKAIQLSKDLSIQQKVSAAAAKQAEIDKLNKELQTKKDEAARIAAIPAPVTGGLGGNFVSLGHGYANGYDFGQCTQWVASNIHVPDSWGNANSWDDYARGMGYAVDENPTIGSIAQTDYGYYGHVAIVIAVNGGQVEVSEMNVQGINIVDEAWYGLYTFKYIHV